METSTPVVLDPAMSPAETGSVSGLAALADKSGAQDGRNPGHLLKSDPTASAGAVAAAVATPVDADPAMSPAESGSISGLAALADKRGAHDSERHHGSSTDAASTAQANKPPTAAAAAATAPQALAEESSDDEDDARRLQFKVIVLGDGTVGKTSLLHRFAFSSFERSYKQTVGVDFFSREVVLPSRHGATHRVSGSSSLLADYSSSSAPSKGLTGPGSSGPTRVDRDTPLASGAASAGSSTTAVLSVWDIGGQNAGSKMLRPYIAGAHAVLLAYDITNADSFYNLEDWLEDVRSAFLDAGTLPPPSSSSSSASASGSLSSRNRGAAYAAGNAAGGAGSGAPSRRRGPLLGVVGNKTDEAYMRAVKPAQHRELCDRLGAQCFLVSAKTGDGVAQMFFRVAAELAGVEVSRGEVAASGGPIPATIVAYADADSKAESAAASSTGAEIAAGGEGTRVGGASTEPGSAQQTAGSGRGAPAQAGESVAGPANVVAQGAGKDEAAAGEQGGRRRGRGDREGKCTVQ